MAEKKSEATDAISQSKQMLNELVDFLLKFESPVAVQIQQGFTEVNLQLIRSSNKVLILKDDGSWKWKWQFFYKPIITTKYQP